MTYVKLNSGIIVSEAAFAEARPERDEIASTADGRDITRGYVDGMPLLEPTDTVLQARGGDYEVYEAVKRDDQVAATLAQRRLAVVSREWEVLPGGEKRRDKAAAESIKDMLDDIGAAPSVNHAAGSPLLGWDSITDKMLWGLFYGFSVAECLWGRDGRQITLDKIKVRNRRRFGFGPDGALKLKTSSNPTGEALPEKKFWTFSVGADHDDEPYGLGLAHWLYWPVLFKRNGIKFWMIFMEKFGMPTGKGTYPASATETEKTRLLQAVKAIQTDSGIILPEGMNIELIEAMRSGTLDYRALQDYMNQAIAKVNLGQVMTSEAVGGQYKADVQMDVRQDLVKSDSDVLCASFNLGPVRWLTDWNYPGAAYPEVWRRIEDEPDLMPQAERDQVISEMGFKPSLKYINETYGGEWVEHEPPPPPDDPQPGAPVPGEPAPSDKPGQEFAEGTETLPGEAELDRLLSSITNEQLQSQAEQLVAPILKLAEQAPDQLLGRLADVYPEMDADALQEQLARVIFIAETWGRLTARDD